METLMFESLKRIFTVIPPKDGVTPLVFSKELAVAVLFLEVAHADGGLAEKELQTLYRHLRLQFGLDSHVLTELVNRAQLDQASAVSLQHFTKVVHEQCSPDEKFQMMVDMWRVAFADGELDKYEEHLIRKVAELIYMPHSEFIRAKQFAKTT